MKLRLPDSIASQQDLSALIIELRGCLKWLTHEAVKQKAGVTAAPLPQTSPAATELLSAVGIDPKKLEILIKALEQTQDSAKVITITLAAQPSNNLKATLVAWCRNEIRNDVLVNFSFNKALLGGMVVRAGSRVFDWSFRRLILDGSDKFPEVLRRV